MANELLTSGRNLWGNPSPSRNSHTGKSGSRIKSNSNYHTIISMVSWSSMLSWSKSPTSSLLRKRGWGWGPTPWGKSGGWVGSVRIWPAFSTQKGNMPTFRWDPGPALFPQQHLPLIISCRGHPCLHLGCDWPLCQSLWTRVSRISLPPYRFLAIIPRQIATHLSSLWGKKFNISNQGGV